MAKKTRIFQIIQYDRLLLVLVLFLVLFGVVMVFEASSVKARELTGDSHYFFKAQLLRAVLGFAVLFILAHIPYQMLVRGAPALLVLSLLSLFYLVAVPYGVMTLNGSKRWVRVAGLVLQPSEFVKLGLVLYLAYYFDRYRDSLREEGKALLVPLLVVGLLSGLILLQPDLGTATMILIITFAFLLAIGLRAFYLSLMVGSGLAGLVFVLSREGYQQKRLLQYISTLRGDAAPPWQVAQSFLSLGSGGFMGLGLGSSRQVLHFLPEPFTDFILAIVGEELGYLGVLFLLIVYLLVVIRGLTISAAAPDDEGMYLGVGLTILLGVYAFFNAAIVAGLIPTTGIPLPFVSFGGSSLIVNLAAVGILLNIASQQGKVQLARQSGSRRKLKPTRVKRR